VLVTTIRALKAHSGQFRIVAGRPLPPALLAENLEALSQGMPNMVKQIENVRLHGVPVVVAINHFPDDTDAEIALVRDAALAAGAEEAVVSRVFAQGGRGGVELAEAVVRVAERGASFRFLYELDASIKEKITTIATKVYGADGVTFEPAAERAIRDFTRLGFDKLPICMAKTHLSLSDNPALRGRPSGFTVTIRDVRASVGAGFLYPLAGQMMTMPGLGSAPGGLKVDIDDEGQISGLN
jgi:formate--tetrahydrofolate ligase